MTPPQSIRYPQLRLVLQISIHFNLLPPPPTNYQCQADFRPPLFIRPTPTIREGRVLNIIVLLVNMAKLVSDLWFAKQDLLKQ